MAEEGDGWRSAPEVFHEWALIGKDEGMEKGHAAAVEEMLSHALAIASSRGNTFTALDVGCGNGWVVRKMARHPHCSLAVGIDAAPSMIDKAKKLDSENQYHLVDIMQWTTEHSFDLIHSMETMYYLEDPVKGIQRLSDWLKKDGVLVIGVDHYAENAQSLVWPEKVRTRMTTLSESQWIDSFSTAGLSDVKSWRAAPKEGWPGTLVIAGRK